MKRRLQVLSVCIAALLAMHLMAQDSGAGAGGAGGGGTDNSGGGAGATDNSGGAGGAAGGGNASGAGTGAGGAGGTGDQGAGGGDNTNGGAAGASPGPGGTGEPGAGTPLPLMPGGEIPAGGGEGTGTTVPTAPVVPEPGEIAPAPTPMPATSGTSSFGAPENGAATQQAPVTFSLPGGYGNPGSQSFTLGEGRLAKPPVTFSVTTSVGYDTNVFDADSNPQATPTPIPGPTPGLAARVIGFHIGPPFGSVPQPIYQIFRLPAGPTPTPLPKSLGVIGSPVATTTVGIQVQKGTPRTVFTLDLSVGSQDYFNEPGKTIDYTGNFDLAMVHRISPRATLSLDSSAVYQNTPNFALVNAPTNNGNGGNYLNGNIKADLTYAWGARLSTVTSASLGFNLLETTKTSNLYSITYGTQFRYTVSARDSVTAEIRQQQAVYPSNPGSNNNTLFYLLGLDSIISARLRNTINAGWQVESYPSGASQSIPYVEMDTTLALPHEGSLTLTNEYGAQETGSPNQTATSYRLALSLSQPLSTKLVASYSMAYNYLVTKGLTATAGSYTQNQLQASLSLGYTLSARLSLSLSYTYIDLLTSQLNSSYQREQIYLGGTYTFK